MPNTIQALFRNGQATNPAKGGVVFRTGDPVRRMHLVTSGRVDLIRHTDSGARLMLFRAGPGQVLAEASAYSDSYHCDGIAARDSQLLTMPVAEFRQRLNDDNAVAAAWAERLARALQAARTNAEIRTLRTVSERLDAWQAGSRPLPPRGELQDLAQTLGVTREALYRELSKRRR